MTRHSIQRTLLPLALAGTLAVATAHAVAVANAAGLPARTYQVVPVTSLPTSPVRAAPLANLPASTYPAVPVAGKPSVITPPAHVLVVPSNPAGTAAGAAPPSITAIADAATAGLFLVAGQGFTPRTTATILVRAADGTTLASLAVSAGATGAFVKTVFLDPPCVPPVAQQVMISAVDASQAVSNAYAVTMSTPLTMAQTQLAGASSALNTVLHSANASAQQVEAAQAAVIADYAQVAAARTAASC